MEIRKIFTGLQYQQAANSGFGKCYPGGYLLIEVMQRNVNNNERS